MKFLKLFSLLVIFFLSNASADEIFNCRKSLSQMRDSSAHYLSVDELDYLYRCSGCSVNDLQDKQFAVQSIKEILKRKNCGQSVINSISVEKTECHRFRGTSLVCVTQSEMGFFNFNRDYVDGAFIIFNRWD